jgi:uracil-DNA glycosylase family 4
MARKHNPLGTQLDFFSELGLSAPAASTPPIPASAEATATAQIDTPRLLAKDEQLLETSEEQSPPEEALSGIHPVLPALETEPHTALRSAAPLSEVASEHPEEEVDLPWYSEEQTPAASDTSPRPAAVESIPGAPASEPPNTDLTSKQAFSPALERVTNPPTAAEAPPIASDADLPWYPENPSGNIDLPVSHPPQVATPTVFQDEPPTEPFEADDIFSAAEELPWEIEEMPPLPAPPVMELAAITQLLDDPLPVVRTAPPPPAPATVSSPLHDQLQTIAQQCASCTRCGLHKGRIQTVFADGNPQAKLMIIGEGPGQNEDETGIPFVGKAGQLLTKMLESVGLNRAEDTYIANIVKCRPPQNRTPTPEEMAACLPHLRAQINLVQPRLIVLAGGTAVKGLIGNIGGITKVRGTWRTWQGIPCMPIFHPSYLLRNESRAVGSPKWETWQDLKAIYARYQALDHQQ